MKLSTDCRTTKRNETKDGKSAVELDENERRCTRTYDELLYEWNREEQEPDQLREVEGWKDEGGGRSNEPEGCSATAFPSTAVGT